MEDRAGFWRVRAWTAVELPYEGDPVTARYQQGRQMVLQPRRSSARNWAALALGTLLLLQSPFANAATVTVDPSIEYQQTASARPLPSRSPLSSISPSPSARRRSIFFSATWALLSFASE